MTALQAPPGRRSIRTAEALKSFGPSQRTRCSGWVQALNTRLRGASNWRVITSSDPASRVALSLGAVIVGVLALQLAQIVVQPVEAGIPERAIALDPVGDLLQRPGLQPAGPPLRRAAARHQPGALQHLQMLGHGGQAH